MKFSSIIRKGLFFLFPIFIAFILLSFTSHPTLASTIYTDSFAGGFNSSLWTLRNGSTSVQTSAFGLLSNNPANVTLVSTLSPAPIDNIVKVDVRINSSPSYMGFYCRGNETNGDFVGATFNTDGTDGAIQFIHGGGGNTNGINWDQTPGVHSFEVDCIGDTVTLKEDNVTLYSGIFAGGSPVQTFASETNQEVWFQYASGDSEFANYQFCDANGCSSSLLPEKIVFYSNQLGTGSEDIALMNPDGSNIQTITTSPGNDFSPSWSYDGTQIAFGSNRDGHYQLYAMNADGTNQHNISNDQYNDFPGFKTFSPNGQKILFESDRTGDKDIYTMNPDGSNQTDLTNNTNYDGAPAWSPDGSKIVFYSDRSGAPQLYTMNPDGSNLQQLTTQVAYSPAWSPDGSKIAFASTRAGDNNNAQIYIMNADGSNQINLTNYPASSSNGPAWSPDGQYITFDSWRGGDNISIYRMNADGSNVIRLLNFNSSKSDWRPGAVSPNHPPTANAGGSYIANEGDIIILQGTGSDADNDTLTYQWDINNDGTYDITGQNVPYSAIDGPAVKTVKLQVCDIHNACTANTATIAINNVAPSAGAITAPSAPVALNTSVNTSVNFTDPGVTDTHTAVWDWGDNTTTNGTVNETNGFVTGSHIYSAAGVYTVKVTVADNNNAGSNISQYQYVVIYDTSSGFISGSGHVTSPVGADPSNSTTGTASFGFSVKYTSGSTIPSGKVKYLFKSDNISFDATSFDWLVVSGSKAYLHGSGTINNTGSYNFLLSAVNGNPDKFRIKIKDNSTNTVIYDTQMNASDFADPILALNSGQIKVQ